MLTAMTQDRETVDLAVCEVAIRKSFAGTCGRIDLRLLWSRGDLHHFRVNWWRLSASGCEHRIEHSEFVAVDGATGVVASRDLSAQAA